MRQSSPIITQNLSVTVVDKSVFVRIVVFCFLLCISHFLLRFCRSMASLKSGQI